MESFNSSMKRKELYLTECRPGAVFRKTIDQYIFFHNTKRPYYDI
ncbi:MAG: hypothetical protein IJ325_09015 [Clostridia bacterium]|nr:hypothetical protein [Clostridia bacterium]